VPPAPRPPRVLSIDLLRGADVLLMLFVNEVAGVRGAPRFLLHTPQGADGMTITDVVFPAFLLITGMAIPFALGGRLRRGQTRAAVLRHVLTRTLALLVMGVCRAHGHRSRPLGRVRLGRAALLRLRPLARPSHASLMEASMTRARPLVAFAATLAAPFALASPLVLTNHLGYERLGPKRAVIQGEPGTSVSDCALEAPDGGRVATAPPERVGPVAHWRNWVYWTVDFSSEEREGVFRLACETGVGEARSAPFRIQQDLLERHTLSDVLYYFKGQRSSGLLDRADRSLPLEGRPGKRVDAHGGWYDATGDYGKHLSHLSFSTYFNPQQLPLTAWGLLQAATLLEERGDPAFHQYLRRLRDEGAWGADYLVRMKVPGGSFYRSVSAPGPGKRPEDRRVGRDSRGFAIKTEENRERFRGMPRTGPAALGEYESSLRAGGGVAIAVLARAAFMGIEGERSADYLRAAEDAWTFLAKHNASLTNDGKENVVDDYCALLAATELYRATHRREYLAAADERAARLAKRLAPGPRAYWRADDGDRPFFHAADAGLPLASLLDYLEIAAPARRGDVLAAVRRSLEWELAVTSEVPNPFGYARQLVQTAAGVRETRFFFPHDTETAPWWQGEDARLASLAYAARRALPYFADDPAFSDRLRRYAEDQLDWILGRNPFDASLLEGTGRNNPEYLFFGSYEYTNAPGGIVNGITSGLDDAQGIAFNLPHTVTRADEDWRWGEQWLPHATWYLLAVAAGNGPRPEPPPPAGGRVVIAYVFPQEAVIDPKTIAADRLTHVNYAFANIRDGEVVEGFAHDAENLRVLTGLRRAHPKLKILVSVGGWTWSGGFSDAALTPESRRRFAASAVRYVRDHDLDGFDVDWEYPGLPGYGNTHRPEDREGFTALMTELRRALDDLGAPQGRHYLLTFAAGAFPRFLEHVEMGKVQKVVDYVNLMTYDFREAGSDGEAGHHAALYLDPRDPRDRSGDAAVREFLAAGVPPDKLVLGVPFYGRAWAGVGTPDFGLFQPGGRPAERIDTSYTALSVLADRDGFVRHWDEWAQAPFLWNARQRVFVSYDDPQSLLVKCRYVREHGLAGAMFWEYASDKSGALLETLAQGLLGR
jgi:GH18 family chitinase